MWHFRIFGLVVARSCGGAVSPWRDRNPQLYRRVPGGIALDWMGIALDWMGIGFWRASAWD